MVPDLTTLDPWALLIATAAMLAMLRFRVGILPIIAGPAPWEFYSGSGDQLEGASIAHALESHDIDYPRRPSPYGTDLRHPPRFLRPRRA